MLYKYKLNNRICLSFYVCLVFYRLSETHTQMAQIRIEYVERKDSELPISQLTVIYSPILWLSSIQTQEQIEINKLSASFNIDHSHSLSRCHPLLLCRMPHNAVYSHV